MTESQVRSVLRSVTHGADTLHDIARWAGLKPERVFAMAKEVRR